MSDSSTDQIKDALPLLGQPFNPQTTLAAIDEGVARAIEESARTGRPSVIDCEGRMVMAFAQASALRQNEATNEEWKESGAMMDPISVSIRPRRTSTLLDAYTPSTKRGAWSLLISEVWT